jgi:hypothetical protein
VTEDKTPRVAGPRNAAHILREVSVLVEQHGVKFPRVQFGSYDGDQVSHYVHGATDYGLPYSDKEGRKRSAQLDIENQFNTITEFWDSLDGPLEWVANDPSAEHQKDYFRLAALYRGARIELWCSRSDIGEFVEQIESGPQVMTDGDTVQLVRQQVTVWKPNISIGRRATPQYELEAKPLVLALTEADPF